MKKHSIKITAVTYYENKKNWIGAGEVKGATEECDVIGYRIVVNNKEKYWMDLTIQEALDLGGNLTLAVNHYLNKHQKYVPNKKLI